LNQKTLFLCRQKKSSILTTTMAFSKSIDNEVFKTVTKIIKIQKQLAYYWQIFYFPLLFNTFYYPT